MIDMDEKTSTRDMCLRDILLVLSKKEMGFEELVQTIPYSRGTVNKYLDELYRQDEVKRDGRRGKYSLTQKGIIQAIKEEFRCTLDRITTEALEGLETSIQESTDNADIIEKKFSKELEKIPDKLFTEPIWESPAISIATNSVLCRQKLEKKDIQKVHDKIRLIVKRDLGSTLSNVPLIGIVEVSNITEIFLNNILNLLSSYSQLWLFILNHPGATVVASNYLEEKIDFFH